MGQVPCNLMGNAIQYGDEVTARVAGNDPEAVTITVQNFGPPIPPKHKGHFFSPGCAARISRIRLSRRRILDCAFTSQN